MTHDTVRDFFTAQQQNWRARDAEKLAGGHTEDGILISPIFRTVSGRPAIQRSYEELFRIFPDWDYRAERVLIDGASVAEPFHVSATHVGEFMGLAGCGRRFEIHGVRVFEMKDGLIAHERRHYDFTGLLIQLGVLRSKPWC
jgi:hypothetical protein